MDDLLNVFSEYMYTSNDFSLNNLQTEIAISDADTVLTFCKFLVMTRDYVSSQNRKKYEIAISALTPDIDF